MYKNHHIVLIIPAQNEAESIGKVLADCPVEIIDDIIVIDNASTDKTSEVARENGALVYRESYPGYGAACLRGLSVVDKTDIIVFMDGDYSDYPEEMTKLLDPLVSGEYDFVLGSRTMGNMEKNAMTLPQRLGTRLSVKLVNLLWKHNYTDMGPFRAISFNKLTALDMRDRTYGWTIEMQIKAIQQNLRILEVPVSYRRRIGISKISGTLSGVVKAGFKIIFTILKIKNEEGSI